MIQDTYTPLTFQEKLYAKLAKSESGKCYDLKKWEENGERKQYLLDQSKDIARKLKEGYHIHGLGWSEHHFVESYQDKDLHLIGLHSRQVLKLPNFRNIIFLPTVAQSNRRSKVKEMGYFLDKNRNCRMWTFTAGPRIQLSDLRDTVKWLHRKLSKLNDQDFMKLARAKFVFRSTEFGELAENGSSDISIHPHMHALLHLDGYLPSKAWSKLLSRICKFWGAHCQDCGRIENPRELIKYCVKPSDLEHLNNRQLIRLFQETQGLRLWESLQDFRKMRRSIRESNQKVVIRSGSPKLFPKWNKGTSTQHDEDALGIPRYEQAKCTEELEAEKVLGRRLQPSPKLVAWCAPAPVFTPVSEPLFLVQGLCGRDPMKMFDTDEVRRMASSIMVHNNTLTVPKKYSEKRKQSKYHESKQEIPPKHTNAEVVY